MAQEIQSVIFDKDNWTVESAREWLAAHDFRSDKVDETDESLRFRQFDPEECKPDSYQTLTEDMPEGCVMVSCDRQGRGAMLRVGKIERRFAPAPELRVSGDKPAVIRGYAAVFERETVLWGDMREKIATGAFTRTLAEGADVRALFNHDPSQILGRNKAGTLRLGEDERGLWYEIDPPDTQAGRDVVESIRRGDITQSSFAFSVRVEEWDLKKKLRTLKDLDLFDVSPVTFPAYDTTEVGLRNLWPDGQPVAPPPELPAAAAVAPEAEPKPPIPAGVVSLRDYLRRLPAP